MRSPALVAASTLALACAPRASPAVGPRRPAGRDSAARPAVATRAERAPGSPTEVPPSIPLAAPDGRAGSAPSEPPGPGWSRLADGVSFRRVRAPSDDVGPLEWLVVRVRLDRATPGAASVPGARLGALAADPRVAFAVDAGFFEEGSREASGLLIAAGETLHGVAPRGGSGTLIVRNGAAVLVDAAAPLPREPRVELAVQCGPRLVESDGSVGIRRDDGRRFARTAACIRDAGRTLDFVAAWSPQDPVRGPGLYDFARRLASPSPVGDPAGCEAALNLDGGPSTGTYARGASAATHAPLGPVPWALVVRD